MIKLLIADDEPLVQIGLKSMIRWEELGIEICGTASNGDNAYKQICQFRPEIVITDIRMPCSSGLDLGKRCLEEFGRLPVFIILTSYEDFQYAKEAMHFQAVEYLVKIDLSPESLTAAVKKAVEQVTILKRQEPAQAEPDISLRLFQDRFYIRLLNNLFENREQFRHQTEAFQITFCYEGYAAANICFFLTQEPLSADRSFFQSYQQTLEMFQELISKYIPCRVIALDTRYLAAVFFIRHGQKDHWKAQIQTALDSTFQMLHNYYNASFFASIGRLAADPMELSVSYYDAKQITEYLSKETPVLFWDDQPDTSSLRNVFQISLFRKEISQAFEELDEKALCEIFKNIIGLLSEHQAFFPQAMDAASNILHLSVTMLTNGTMIVSEIFQDEPDSYQSLYRQKTTKAIIAWLTRLQNGLCKAFQENKKNYKNVLAAQCCQYINKHIHERIYLQDLADTFGVSPNYLSQLFKKHMEIGISEYISNQKIAESKRLLRETTMKIYEISDALGFENAFYFSKVFKKTTGIPPKDYRNNPQTGTCSTP